MKLLNALAILTLMFGISVFASELYANEDEHHHSHDSKPNASQANTPQNKLERKFATDKNLRQGMDTVLDTMMKLHRSESSGFAKNQLIDAGKNIEAAVQGVFKNCKLAPEADAALHPVLSEILAGAGLFKDGKFESGHEKIHFAFIKYEDFFEHAGWRHHRGK